MRNTTGEGSHSGAVLAGADPARAVCAGPTGPAAGAVCILGSVNRAAQGSWGEGGGGLAGPFTSHDLN